ncbi:hypothetical protein [Dyadobacter sp. NIV53]|uniref:hypothetical protein n=1 Tax=Dyadobacter sp. NIV53 TaxID=2861765 RepID=UPI001C869CEE|nr:hypothetical protein [Dyadobacter sp. NIV53]
MRLIYMAVIFVVVVMTSRWTPKKKPSGYPQDFTFRLERTAFNYDSQTHKYNYFDKSVIVALTDEELQAIYEYARDTKYLNFPKEFKCDGKEAMVPCFTDRLEVRYNNKYKISINDDCCSKIEKGRPEQFDHLVRKITEILDAREQVRNLPKYHTKYM